MLLHFNFFFFFRYGGFCPQFKYQIGNTFGKTTCRLLDDKNVASSGNLVLADIRASAPASLKSDGNDFRAHLLRSRTQSWGDQKLIEKMIPGYTGIFLSGQALPHMDIKLFFLCLKGV